MYEFIGLGFRLRARVRVMGGARVRIWDRVSLKTHSTIIIDRTCNAIDKCE